MKLEEKSFSDADMLKLCENKTKIITYSDLAKYNTIEDVLAPHNSVIILYLTKENYGHWVALFVDPNDEKGKTLEFFDSYAIPIDGELSLVPENFRNVSNQDFPHLTYLINMSNNFTTILYNKEKLQKFKKNINTCGRWAGMRIAMKDVPLLEFQKLFINQKFPPDWYVTAFTAFIK